MRRHGRSLGATLHRRRNKCPSLQRNDAAAISLVSARCLRPCLHDDFSAGNFVTPRCIRNVPCAFTREKWIRIRKVDAAARWRLNIHVEPIIRFYSTLTRRACRDQPSLSEGPKRLQRLDASQSSPRTKSVSTCLHEDDTTTETGLSAFVRGFKSLRISLSFSLLPCKRKVQTQRNVCGCNVDLSEIVVV